jgi:hypothetical protein
MSSALSSPFMSEHIAEVVPDVAKVAGKLAQSSVITGRRRVRLVPQSGQTYGSGNSAGVVNILIQDGQAYADLLSAVVSFNLTTFNSALGASGVPTAVVPALNQCCVADDGAWSVFRRSLISVNSTLMDDTDFVAKKINAEIYATASDNWYNNVGSFCGLWKYNTNWGAGAGSANNKYNVVNRIPLQSQRVQAGTVSAGGSLGVPQFSGMNKYCIPLSLLTSFFRNDTLFPSRNAGQLYVQLNVASALEALWNASNPGTGQFQLTNLTLELDFVDLHPTYLSMMDDIIESPSGSGVQWKFDAHMTATQSLPSSQYAGLLANTTLALNNIGQAFTSGGGGGQQSVIVSKASQNMRSLHVVVQPSAVLSSGTWFPQSTFANPGFVDIQYRIGSLYFPAFTSIGEQRAYFDLQNAFGSPESIDKSGLVDNFNYYLTTWAATTSASQVQTMNNNGTPIGVTTTTAGATTLTAPVNATGTGAGVPTPNVGVYADMWMYAYCFDRLKHATLNGIDLDGINTLTSAGSQMVVQINCNPVDNSQMTAFVRFTRILVLKNGATQVVG